MSPKPPGHVKIEDDIEMIGMEDVVERTHSPRENGATAKPYTPVRDVTAEDSEDDDDMEEEDSRALLGSPHHGRARKLLDPIGKRWPQIGSIVVEVRGIYIYTAHLMLKNCRVHRRCS